MAMTAPEPVTSMLGFLEEVLAEAEEIDARMHEGIGRLRERIAALKLAEDPGFVEALGELRRRIDAGEPLGEEVDLDERAARYR